MNNRSIEEWGTPISKDKIIYRRNKLIELAKVETAPYTIWYETVNENILDINYMIYEIDRLNNIINELEKYLIEHKEVDWDARDTIIHEALAISFVYDILQDLKEGE